MNAPATPESAIKRNALPIGVLVMAYGGPNSVEEVPGYLADIRSGRPTPPSVVAEISNNYRRIGGKSPLLENTRRQVDALAARFDPDRVRFYLGMRHWSPWIEEVVGRMVEDGITHAVSLALAPHFSSLSVKKYHEKIRDGLEMYRGSIQFNHIAGFHDGPQFIAAWRGRVLEGLSRWSDDERDEVHVVFTAHSLPKRILTEGDPYDDQVRETASLTAEAAGLAYERWTFSYQSAGRSAEPWLGPQLKEHLVSLSENGIQNVLVVPVGFVSDHVEVLYDIDIDAKAVAEQSGMRLERAASLNDDPVFIGQLADLIEARVRTWLPEPVTA